MFLGVNIEIILMLIIVAYVAVTVFSKFIKVPLATTVIKMPFWKKNDIRKICVLIFHEESGAADLINDFWHTCVSAVGCSVHQQMIYKPPFCRCVRMTQCELASIAWELFPPLFPGGILSTDTLQLCNLIYSCSAWKLFILKQILDPVSF